MTIQAYLYAAKLPRLERDIEPHTCSPRTMAACFSFFSLL